MIFTSRSFVTFRSSRVFQDDYESIIIYHPPEICVGDRTGSPGGSHTASPQVVRGGKRSPAATGFYGQSPP
jgi:hypothetical protein